MGRRRNRVKSRSTLLSSVAQGRILWPAVWGGRRGLLPRCPVQTGDQQVEGGRQQGRDDCLQWAPALAQVLLLFQLLPNVMLLLHLLLSLLVLLSWPASFWLQHQAELLRDSSDTEWPTSNSTQLERVKNVFAMVRTGQKGS